MKLPGRSCFFLVCFALSCATPGPKPTSTTRLRILSYNIHHGEGTDGRLDLERLARVIKAAEPDLVALQEVDDRAARTGGVNQAAELGKLTGMIASFGQAMPLQGGGYGQAILSKVPLQSRAVHTLPQQPGREPRIAMVAQTTSGAHAAAFLFATTHLDHEVESIRLQQANRLDAILRTNTLPVILAGDLNATPESPSLQLLSQNWADSAAANSLPTIPSENPNRRIDYILLYPQSAWRVLETQVLNEPIASDHRPVLAVVELLNGR